jgi:hypothetical protein
LDAAAAGAAAAAAAAGGATAAPGALSELIGEMNPDWHSNWAWSHYEELVLRLSSRFGLSALCEIGGGWLVWQTVRERKPWYYAAAGAVLLVAYGLVPCLHDDGFRVWDSLAICEYLAECYPEAGLWPSDPGDRALARSAAAEMHSGFSALRRACPMDIGARLAVEPDEEVTRDIRRIVELWSALLARSGGVHEQFTFTGGVAKNTAAVDALRGLVRENYGERTLNISPDSIYTGALGAALFAWRELQRLHDEAEEVAS